MVHSAQSFPLASNLGYPRIGARRELKRATEAFWRGAIDASELHETARALREANWRKQQAAGIDLIPSNDFSFYDHVLDMACLVGAIPPRFGWAGDAIDLETYFLLARGAGRETTEAEGEHQAAQASLHAMEMTKWFDTNYHYMVPEFHPHMTFRCSSTKPFDEFAEAAALGITTRPVLLGPVTFLSLGKLAGDAGDFNRWDLLEPLLAVYGEVLQRLAGQGAEWVQLDEPICATDLDDAQKRALQDAYAMLAAAAPELNLLCATYFGPLGDNLSTLLQLPVRAVHVDAVRGAAELDAVVQQLPPDKMLSAGIVDGRNIWKNDLERSLATLERVCFQLGAERLIVAPSCSLLHVPIALGNETALDAELAGWLAFAEEKLTEVSALARALRGQRDEEIFERSRQAIVARAGSAKAHQPAVAARLASVTPEDYARPTPSTERRQAQHAQLRLPLFPTTVVGSFPQTAEVRAKRARWKQGKLAAADYEAFIEEEIGRTIRLQEALGLDMLAHGEFERNDMVEYFGERLDGFAVTRHGWVQSYGTRYVKPPIIFGDVARREPMTVRWVRYAQSCTEKPVKGMLTGPVTMVQWSFARDDQSRERTAMQIALAIRDEVADLERAGLAAIQIDEPALREGLPLRRAEWDGYLRWAVRAFRLASSGVQETTQIHTHMCYAEFNDIIDAIAALDADVISIEAARSNMEILQAFVDFNYPNEIGPGVYDIHSPRVPPVAEIQGLIERAREVLPVRNIWINPDCGLKTRRWEEVLPALRNLVEAARQQREALGAGGRAE